MNRDMFDRLTKYGNTIALKNDGDLKGYIVGGGYERARGIINADGHQSLLRGYGHSEPKKETDQKTFNRMTEGLSHRLKNQELNKGKTRINNFVQDDVENKNLINIRTIRRGKSKRKAGIGGVF